MDVLDLEFWLQYWNLYLFDKVKPLPLHQKLSLLMHG
jgi:hypothetical protein